MSKLGFAILAALCGSVVVQGDPTLLVNIDKFGIKQRENPFFGEWSYTLTPGKPRNKLSLNTPVKSDMPEDMMVRLNVKSAGKQLPLVESEACKALLDEVVGKGFVESGNPFPKVCPVKKGDYKIENYVVKEDYIPPGMPDGRMVGIFDFYIPGDDPFMTFEFEGEITHNAPSLG